MFAVHVELGHPLAATQVSDDFDFMRYIVALVFTDLEGGRLSRLRLRDRVYFAEGALANLGGLDQVFVGQNYSLVEELLVRASHASHGSGRRVVRRAGSSEDVLLKPAQWDAHPSRPGIRVPHCSSSQGRVSARLRLGLATDQAPGRGSASGTAGPASLARTPRVLLLARDGVVMYSWPPALARAEAAARRVRGPRRIRVANGRESARRAGSVAPLLPLSARSASEWAEWRCTGSETARPTGAPGGRRSRCDLH
eukprot:scaffold1017_cov374-Prasinococcus_capsulatus_cf.AAC.13